MSWVDRLRETIKFVSPSGRVFEALWIGNDRTKTKKLGQFSPPKRRGTIIQDLDVDSTVYPLNFIFEGTNHDIEASLFFQTCDENGRWEITHPVHGILSLQLTSITEKNNPIESGNLTRFESQWIEPLDEDQTASSAEIANQIEQKLTELNAAAAAQLEGNAKQDTASRIQAIKNAASQASQTIQNGLSKISALSTEIANITNAVQRATTSNLLNPTVALNSLATQLQIAAQTPALATNNIQERVKAYTDLSGALSGNNPTVANFQGKNTLSVKEIALVAVASTLPRIVSTGDIQTKNEAITLAELIAQLLDDITNDLDEGQELFQNNLLESQYFSHSEIYGDLIVLMGLGIEFLLRSIFDLRIEKRFNIDRNRTPIDITISEYGELGENDQNLNLFIVSNQLSAEELILLPSGREVVVYV